jgi:exopolysaccharide biosynthesis polyprenyl glycosylphosphotransferase
VLAPDVFLDMLRRERKRADRCGHAFSVLLVEVTPGAGDAAPAEWEAITRALSAVKRDTDLVGWFEQDAVVGLLLAEISRGDGSVPAKVESRVRRELARRLGDEALATVSVKRYTHAGGPLQAGEGSPVEPLLETLPVAAHTRLHRAGKRALDVAGSLALLLALSPVFAIVAAAVKLTSRGPVFFRQERVGIGGRPFRMLKFRSMYTDAGHALHQDYVTWFITQSDQKKGADGEVFKLQNDPRITRIGHFLRRSSLDELPQFWNVLAGDMSLVGPRPPLPFEVEKYQPWHRRRVLDAMPGITGLWQVEGRSRTTFDEMVRLDLRYAKSPSIWTDIRILAATPRAVITGKGAC